jgi:acyl transferase domain-containing protein/acyl carrier protein
MNDKILSTLIDIFAEVLLCPKEDLSLDKAYVDMGVDSILAIHITKLIKSKLDIELLSSDLYNFLSINHLAKHLSTYQEHKQSDTFIETTSNSHLGKTTSNINNEKIAIIGIAGRFPGADNVDQYWQNLINGKNSITTTQRWSHLSNKEYRAGFLNNIENFDAELFNISPKEAILMDPQQRLLMEVTWEALIDAGLSLEDLNGSNCGVFTTSLPGDYKYNLSEKGQSLNTFSFLGNAVSVLSGRISHFFNLKGPSIYIDTACSSSLIAIDLAIKHLQDLSCDIAIVGASCIFSTPELFDLAEASNLISKSGLCHTFDHKADGFIPAETVGCLVLRRLSDAKKNQQQIYAVIEGHKTNHDGSTNGLMSPNSNSQKELIITTYQKNDIDISKIGYIEAHGTGTAVGDPIETKALTEGFEKLNKNYNSFLGSSKTNIGHALVSSGIASVIKVLLIFKHSTIPPHLHFTALNPQISLGNFKINTVQQNWPADKDLAAISAFGFSGTNAHIVLRKVESISKNSNHNKTSLPFNHFNSKPFWIKGKDKRADPTLILDNNKPIVELKNQYADIDIIINIIKEKLSSILGYNLSDISEDKNLNSFGIDSIIALQLLEPFKKEFGEINSNIIFDSKNIKELAEH